MFFKVLEMDSGDDWILWMYLIPPHCVFKNGDWDFPGYPMVKISTARGIGLIPGQGTKIWHATWHNQNKF